MAETRRGRQTPTQCVVLPYRKTLGQDAIERYEQTAGRHRSGSSC